MTQFSTIGRPRKIIEGRAKVTGATRYATDLTVPGMLHARFVTSPYAHATINHIDIETAMDAPGVVAVLTAADMPDIPPNSRPRLLLARGRAMFVGQPVALVLAETEAAAQDGSELVFIDYDPHPAAITIDEALAETAPLVWPDGPPGDSEEAAAHGAEATDAARNGQRPSNVVDQMELGRGDVETGFAEAEVIVEKTITTPRAHQNYLEPHATLVQIDPFTGGAKVWTSTQAPFLVREQVAAALAIPESDVEVVATPVGGAFGSKFLLYQPLVALAAKAAGRPVRLVLNRLEEMLTTQPSQALRIRIRLGAKNDGTLTALEADITIDSGCYPSSLGGLASTLIGSIYRIPHISVRSTEVVTFTVSSGAYRAPTAPQTNFALETAMDEVAQTVGLDPLTLRLKNAVEAGDLLISGRPWPTVGMKQVLERLQTHPAWQQRAEARAAGRGVGIAIGAWPGGTEPSAATCSLQRDGTLHLHLGSVDLSGTATGFTMIAAEVFGLSPDRVRIVAGNTSGDPYAGGAGGSKITYTVGPSVIQAAAEARKQTLTVAAEELEAAPEDLEIVNGQVQVRGVPSRAIPLGTVAGKTMQFGGKYAPILGHGRHVEPRQGPAFCAQLAEVGIDRDTGEATVYKLVVVQDVGRVINPLTLQGQMMGGAAQGIGWALYEQLVHDERGQLLTASWMDYTFPHSNQVPFNFETITVEVPSDHGPFGARGAGEPPIIATAAAVANAIADATGVRLTDLPMTAPRVLAALSRER